MHVGSLTIGRGILEPGWRWSTSLKPIQGTASCQVHHLEDVDDLAQEVFLAALGSLANFRRGDDFGAWLRGIARKKLLNYFRSSDLDGYRELIKELGLRR